LHQDVAYPIEGLVIVALKRHVHCLDELSENEAAQLMQLLRRVRAAQREVLAIDHVYYFYNEDTTHHFHVWMVPRYGWMKQFGRSIQSVRPVLHHARDNMQDRDNIEKVKSAVQLLREDLSKYSA
jgi:diadenosine tetraphosphate (Ap4A) HIT family hydrolase